MKRQRITLGSYLCHVPNWASGQWRIFPKAGDCLTCAQIPAEKRGPQTFNSLNPPGKWVSLKGRKMSHIENELRRCKTKLRKASGDKYANLYAIQQSLEWAIDPMSYASPVDTVVAEKIGAMDTPVDSKGCSAAPHLPQS